MMQLPPFSGSNRKFTKNNSNKSGRSSQYGKQSFFAALLLHMLVFSAIFISIRLTPSTTRQGEKEATFISSYLYQTKQQNKISGTKKQALLAQKTPSQENNQQTLQQNLFHNTVLTPNALASNKASVSKPATSPPSAQAQSSSQGEQAKGLLALLHAAIQNKQQYPPSALQMQRQGRVTVGFKLYPNGVISELQLVKSCGTTSLDAAALAAVRLAAPFKQVDTYLKTVEDFTIDIVFALDEENE